MIQLLEKKFGIFNKDFKQTNIDPMTQPFRHLLERSENLRPQKVLPRVFSVCVYIHIHIYTYIFKNWTQSKIYINKRMDNQIMVYLYNGILFGSKKEQRPDSHNMNNMMVNRMRKKKSDTRTYMVWFHLRKFCYRQKLIYNDRNQNSCL